MTRQIPLPTGKIQNDSVFMKSRERVRLALNHKTPDRVPTFFRIHTPQDQIIEEEKIDYIAGVIDIGKGAIPYLRMKDPPPTPAEKGKLHYDELGIGRKYTGLYWEIVDFPLAEVQSREELEDYDWPEVEDQKRVNHLSEEAQEVIEEGNAVAVMGSWGGSTSFFELSWYMRGLERFLKDLIVNVPFAEALLDKQLELHERRWRKILQEIGDVADLVCIGDDLATQDSLLISPCSYRSLIKPRQRELIKFIKKYTDAKIYYHTDGAIEPLIPDLIEVGVDVLDPIQPTALDTARLKERYGDRLSFFGGIDLQYVMPRGDVAEVREEVFKRFKQMGQGGGLILGPSHWLQPDTPWENIHTLYETIKECKY